MEDKEFFIEDDGIKLHAKLEFPTPNNKDKYPVAIVIHGFTGHMEETHIVEVAKAIRETGMVTLRVELYGHGKSDGKFYDHTLYKWISNVIAAIDYARALPFATDLYLCGHSQGGLVTMLVGALEQDRLKAIIPLSPAAMIPEGARKGELLGTQFDPNNVPEYLDSWDDLKLGGNYIRVAQSIHVGKAVKAFKKPVLMVHGSADEAVPLKVSQKYVKKYSDAKLIVIPDDTHCYDNNLKLVCNTVKDFLMSLNS